MKLNLKLKTPAAKTYREEIDAESGGEPSYIEVTVRDNGFASKSARNDISEIAAEASISDLRIASVKSKLEAAIESGDGLKEIEEKYTQELAQANEKIAEINLKLWKVIYETRVVSWKTNLFLEPVFTKEKFFELLRFSEDDTDEGRAVAFAFQNLRDKIQKGQSEGNLSEPS